MNYFQYNQDSAMNENQQDSEPLIYDPDYQLLHSDFASLIDSPALPPSLNEDVSQQQVQQEQQQQQQHPQHQPHQQPPQQQQMSEMQFFHDPDIDDTLFLGSGLLIPQNELHLDPTEIRSLQIVFPLAASFHQLAEGSLWSSNNFVSHIEAPALPPSLNEDVSQQQVQQEQQQQQQHPQHQPHQQPPQQQQMSVVQFFHDPDIDDTLFLHLDPTEILRLQINEVSPLAASFHQLAEGSPSM